MLEKFQNFILFAADRNSNMNIPLPAGWNSYVSQYNHVPAARLIDKS